MAVARFSRDMLIPTGPRDETCRWVESDHPALHDDHDPKQLLMFGITVPDTDKSLIHTVVWVCVMMFGTSVLNISPKLMFGTIPEPSNSY